MILLELGSVVLSLLALLLWIEMEFLILEFTRHLWGKYLDRMLLQCVFSLSALSHAVLFQDLIVGMARSCKGNT